MKTIQPTVASQKLVGEVKLARLRLAKAESKLAKAKELARLARQRRKAAKLAARRAKKRAKLAKEQVAGTKVALAELEAWLARLNRIPATAKPRNPLVKPAAVASRRQRPAPVMAAPSAEALNARKPLARRAKFKSKACPAVKKAASAITVSPKRKSPVVSISPEVCKATGQIVKEVEGIFTKEIHAATPDETGVTKPLPPSGQTPATPNPLSVNATINPQETP